MAEEKKLILEQVVIRKGSTALTQMITPKFRLKNDDIIKVINDFGPQRTEFLWLKLYDVGKITYSPRDKTVLFATISLENLAAYGEGELAQHELVIGDKVQVECRMGSHKDPVRVVVTKL